MLDVKNLRQRLIGVWAGEEQMVIDDTRCADVSMPALTLSGYSASSRLHKLVTTLLTVKNVMHGSCSLKCTA